MARKPGPGRCVHCLKYVDKRNWDHVFPKAWYPETTPQNLAKWQIPTCKPCNDTYGRMEQDLLIRLALCLNPSSPDTSGLVMRALRSIDPDAAKNQGDRRARQAKRDQLLSEMIEGKEIPFEGIYPNFGERWGRPVEHQSAITVPKKSIKKFCEKIVRGIHFLESAQYIEPPYDISFFAMTDVDAEEIVQILKTRGERYARKPGIEIFRAVAQEDRISSIYCISIFEQLKMYATIEQHSPTLTAE